MQNNVITNAHLANKKKMIISLLGTKRKQISFFVPIFRNTFLLIVTVIITDRFKIHFKAKLCDL